ncbi:hypothetical protein G5714_000543 [Onychostoma macrolepis]|uniref:Uncharacterized protein n=1 Tax=Onychostoma macrolepis TaxID=369639 RepID=A0A7J6DGM6_9TELE|nr:hypothetical protein G5714_000543 [Onychostoma macrolepis]
MRARRSLDSAVGQHLKASSSRPQKFVEKRVGTEKAAERPPNHQRDTDLLCSRVVLCALSQHTMALIRVIDFSRAIDQLKCHQALPYYFPSRPE